MVENLKFLINQTEERIKLVDTKASVILAFFGLMIGGSSFFENLIIRYSIPLWYCYLILFFLFFSFFFLILTIRPVKNWDIIWDFKSKKKISHEDISFFVKTEQQADAFDIHKIQDVEANFQQLFKQLTKKRILKYKNYRRSMWFLRIAIFSVIPYLLIIVIKTFFG